MSRQTPDMDLETKELARLRKALPKEQNQELEGALWILRRRPENLEVKDKETLAKLFQYSPLLKQAYQFKNELTQFLDSDIDRRRGKQRMTG